MGIIKQRWTEKGIRFRTSVTNPKNGKLIFRGGFLTIEEAKAWRDEQIRSHDPTSGALESAPDGPDNASYP